jgi:hypothetical protein
MFFDRFFWSSNSAPSYTILKATNIATTSCTLSWSAATDINNDPVTYFLYRDDILIASNLQVLTYSVTGMTPGSSVTFSIETYDGKVYGPRTSIVVTFVKTWAQVYEKWYRFSHDTTTNQPANASELTTWTYDATGDYIQNNTNSVTYIGFISTEYYENYYFQIQLTANSDDDDCISVVLAFAVDEKGFEHTLSAVRLRNNNQFYPKLQWAIVYDYNRSTQALLANGDSKIAISVGSWNTVPNGTTVRVERTGDIFVAKCSPFNSTVVSDASALTIDLNSDARLAVFKGPQRYGIGCLSQQYSRYSNLIFNYS